MMWASLYSKGPGKVVRLYKLQNVCLYKAMNDELTLLYKNKTKQTMRICC